MMDSAGVFVFFLLGIVLTQECLAAQVEVDPREALVLPMQNVTVMCRVAVPLQYCRVEIPSMKALNLNAKLSYPDVSYYGSGLSAGQCGYTIHNVTERMNGQIKCTLGIETEAQESEGFMQLIVARAPKIPELDLSRGTDSLRVYKVNDILQASCMVRDGRPVANISWYLEDEPLYRDGLSMPTVLDLAKENLQSKIQNLTRILQPTDNGKHLRCVAYHPAYPNGVAETQRQLDVKYSPLPQRDLGRFGYNIGQPGVISVEIEANPKPQIEWDIGSERIKEGSNDQSGRMAAEAARELGRGKYEVNLRIAAIKKEDTEKQYVLRAYNDMGSQDYSIKISTSPEPEGLQLVGIGAIIGIVVGILVVLLVVFLLIFAKVTGRWCFSGQQDTRTLGETSDTESAEVRPKEHRTLPLIKLTSFFRKSRDREASAEDEPEDTSPPEETKVPLDTTLDEGKKDKEPTKESLVYAELDLVSPTSVKPVVKNDDEKTEYAEIVYTQNETDDKKKAA